MDRLIKIGIVGLGKMGEVRFEAVRQNPLMKVVAVSDVDKGKWAKFDDVMHTEDYTDLLAADLDAVFVCTPNLHTPEVVIAALDRGKHVFCEKPPGRNLGDIGRIIGAEERNGHSVLKFGLNHRYHGSVREAKSIVDSGRLGRILWMRGVYGKSGGVGFEESWRSSREMAGGGILLDQGIHMLDLFRFFCGDFEEVKSFVAQSYWNIDVEDNAFALLRNDRNQVAMLHSTSTHWKHTFALDIYLSEGYLEMNGILSGTRSYGRETLTVGRKQFEDESFAVGNPREEVTHFDQDTSFQMEVDDFADCIVNGKAVEHGSSYDALQAMALVDRISRCDSA